jgi:hypothetical protein
MDLYNPAEWFVLNGIQENFNLYTKNGRKHCNEFNMPMLFLEKSGCIVKEINFILMNIKQGSYKIITF